MHSLPTFHVLKRCSPCLAVVPALQRLRTGRGALVGLLAACCLVAGCAPSITASSSESSAPRRSADAVESQLREAAVLWEGTPHVWGGTSRDGVDCSGLVQSIFAETLQHRLPRTTDRQVATGRRVSSSALLPGDLVFFRPSWKNRHVGIYLSDGEFLHASSRSGVTISSLRTEYWQERWVQSRRVLSVQNETSAALDSVGTPASRSVGW